MLFHKSFVIGILAVAIPMAVNAQDVVVKDSKDTSSNSIFNFFLPKSTTAEPSKATDPNAQQDPAGVPVKPPEVVAAKPSLMTPVPKAPQARQALVKKVFITPAQQDRMAQREQRMIDRLQGVTAELQKYQTSLQQKSNRTTQQNDTLARLQDSNAKLNDIVQKSAQRLQVLRSGPLTTADLKQLYAN